MSCPSWEEASTQTRLSGWAISSQGRPAPPRGPEAGQRWGEVAVGGAASRARSRVTSLRRGPAPGAGTSPSLGRGGWRAGSRWVRGAPSARLAR